MFVRCRRSLALLLAVAVSGVMSGLVSPVAAAPTARLAGKVLGLDGATPQSGVVVALWDETTDEVFRSEPTGDDGRFRLERAPAGSYSVVAETERGAYLAGDPVRLDSGDNRPVTLTLSGAAPSYQSSNSTGSGGGLSTVVKWVIVGAIVVGAALVIDEVTSDEEEDATPF